MNDLLYRWIDSFYREYSDPDGIKYKNEKIIYNDRKYYEDYRDALTAWNKKQGNNDFLFSIRDGFPGLCMYSRKTGKSYYLKSDQFGFSIPSGKMSHPYDIYLKRFGDPDPYEAVKKVESWIKKSRIVGGSFFWPVHWKDGKFLLGSGSDYNIKRGGSLNRKSYIEDRVDITLYEVKEVIEAKEDNDLTYNVLAGSPEEVMWLKEFSDFTDYVNVFCFDPFVDKVKNKPFDILSEETKKVIEGFGPEKRNAALFDHLLREPKTACERVFDNVADMIGARNNLLMEAKNEEFCFSF
ncbi:MAG: hypothetical protein K5770_03390 [Lachnospiraceae bacterium]|nr:hypothetical protein [Lachnospiraceae bacterium]